MVSQAVGGTVNYFLVTLYEYPAAHVVKLDKIKAETLELF